MSYSIQWFVFGLLGFIAWGYLFWQEYQYGPAEKTTRPKKKRGVDEAFEDDAYDALEGRVADEKARVSGS